MERFCPLPLPLLRQRPPRRRLCRDSAPRPEIAQITSPTRGQSTGTVDVTGTAARPRFDRYEFDYRRTGGDVWHQYLGLSWTESIANGVSGISNPYEPRLKLPLGEYQLRLRVVDRTGNYGECVVTFSVE